MSFSSALQTSIFDGITYEEERDFKRLNAQQERVFNFMKDGRWHTLDQISKHTGDPPASISARLRDLRKPKNGGYIVMRRYAGKGLFTYKLDLSN